MSQDHELDPVVGADPPQPAVPAIPEPPPLRIPRHDSPAAESEDGEHAVVAWAKAIFGGIGDTAKQMLDEGRRGAQEAYDDGWKRFDDKTRYRRGR